MNIKEIFKVTINLVLIYAIGGALLAWVYSVSAPIIYKNKQEDKANALKGMMPIHLVANSPEGAVEAIKAVLPEGAEVSLEGNKLDVEVDVYKKDKKKLLKMIKKAGALGVEQYSDFDPGKPKGTWEPSHKHAEYFEVKGRDGEIVGYIVESYHKGYAGSPGIYVAMDKDLVVQKIEILSHGETPGLGDEIEKNWFKDQFRGKKLDQMEVVKGETEDKIQAITGATISTRAITYGVRDAVEHMRKYKAGELSKPDQASEGTEAEEGSSGH